MVCSDSFKILSVAWQLCLWHGPSLTIFVFALTLQGGCQCFSGEMWVRNSTHSLYLSKKNKEFHQMKKENLRNTFVFRIAVACYISWSNKSSQGAKHARVLVQCFLTAGAVSSICCITAVLLAESLSYQSLDLVRLSWAHLCVTWKSLTFLHRCYYCQITLCVLITRSLLLSSCRDSC